MAEIFSFNEAVVAAANAFIATGGLTPTFSDVTITGGTTTVSNPVLDMTQTWNNAATSFTGLKLNVTNTASAAGSLMDLQVGGVSQFKVDYRGIVDAAGRFVAPFYYVNSDTGAIFFGASLDTAIQRDGAANTLALRNGTAAQAFRVYSTYTDGSNYERGVFRWNSNTLEVGTEKAGTGAVRQVGITTDATQRWIFNPAGHFIAATDNTYDIGASGANRPRHLYVASNITTGGNVTGLNWVGSTAVSGLYPGGVARAYIAANASDTLTFANAAGTNSVNLTIGASNLLTLNGGLTIANSLSLSAGNQILFGANARIVDSASGNLLVSTAGAGTGFGLLQFGGTTSSFPALKRSTTGIQVRLADDSAFAPLASSTVTTSDAAFLHNTSAALANGAAAQVATMTNGPTAGNPTKWIAINDNGTTRYIPAW